MGTIAGANKKKPCLRCGKYFYTDSSVRVCGSCHADKEYQSLCSSFATSETGYIATSSRGKAKDTRNNE